MVEGEEENHIKEDGRSTPRTAEDSTQKGNRDVIVERAVEMREGGRGGEEGGGEDTAAACKVVMNGGCAWVQGQGKALKGKGRKFE